MVKKSGNQMVEQAHGEVVVQPKDGAETIATEKVGEELTFDAPPCRVGFKAGMTINTGNYSSVRFDVSIEIPCDAVEVDDVYEFAKNWVDNRAEEVVDEIHKTYGVGA